MLVTLDLFFIILNFSKSSACINSIADEKRRSKIVCTNWQQANEWTIFTRVLLIEINILEQWLYLPKTENRNEVFSILGGRFEVDDTLFILTMVWHQKVLELWKGLPDPIVYILQNFAGFWRPFVSKRKTQILESVFSSPLCCHSMTFQIMKLLTMLFRPLRRPLCDGYVISEMTFKLLHVCQQTNDLLSLKSVYY